MSSIIRTIDALKELHEGDYVMFHEGRLGYVQEIVSPKYSYVPDNVYVFEKIVLLLFILTLGLKIKPNCIL